MIPNPRATREAVARYLDSEQGRDVPEAVAVRLRRLPWHVILPDRTPDGDDVHLLRGLVEQKLLHRRADNSNG